MLKKLRLHNFRTYINAELQFERRHLLIGKNNSGKTNFCQALRFLAATASGELTDAANAWVYGGIRELTNWQLKSNTVEFAIECDLPFHQHDLQYLYELVVRVGPSPGLALAGSAELQVVKERLVVSGGASRSEVLIDNDGHEARVLEEHTPEGGGDSTPAKSVAPPGATMLSRVNVLLADPRTILFRRFLGNWGYYSINPYAARTGWKQTSRSGILAPHGENLAISIFQLKNQDERRYRRMLERVRPVEPDLEAINFYVAPDQQDILPFVTLSSVDQASWLGLSDGTLRALALSFLIEISDILTQQKNAPPPLLLIEEPENGIYGGLLRKMLEDFEDCAPLAQIIFTSHSPFFIDLFANNPNSVTLLQKEREHTKVLCPVLQTDVETVGDRLSLSERYFTETLG